jgi:brefeldin A-inhibited guanine nucleotide-exchange protein
VIRIFNKRPKDTVEKLITAGIFPPNDPKTIATYLWETNGLSKKSIGDYLTDDSEFEQSVLREYIMLQGIAQTDVLTALRMFLNSFQMCGEGQIVDRVMMAFAECYCKCNESSKVFSHPDQCHIFLYAVMLLQTSLHNPNVKNGMKSSEFVKLCECCALPKDFLLKTYNDVKKRPFEHDNIAATTRNVLLRHSAKKGFLDKQSKFFTIKFNLYNFR